MPSYYYVRNGATVGSATGNGGRYTSPKTATDAWGTAFSATTEYYLSIGAALAATTAPVAGDFIVCANDHSHSYGAGTSLDFATYDTGSIFVTSVDINNVGQYSSGAYEETGSTNLDLTIRYGVTMSGMHFKSNDDMTFGFNTNLVAYDCTFEIADRFISIDNESILRFYNCVINLGPSQYIQSSGASYVFFYNTDFIISSTAPTFLFNEDGGGNYFLEGCDLSDFTNYITENTSFSNRFDMRMELVNCRTSASLTGYVQTSTDPNPTGAVKAVGCGSGDAAEYQYFYSWRANVVEEDTSIYRDGSTAFPGGQKISLKVTTTSDCTLANPFIFDLPSRFVDLSNTASDKITIYILSSATLTDTDVWAWVSYPDGTDREISRYLNSRNSDILAAGTGLTTNSESWTGDTSENLYQIDLDTSGVAGSDGVPFLRFGTLLSSATFYICPTYGLS